MALNIGELYAVLGLESKDFYKDLDKSEKAMTGLSFTFFKAAAASGKLGKSMEQPAQMQSLLDLLTGISNFEYSGLTEKLRGLLAPMTGALGVSSEELTASLSGAIDAAKTGGGEIGQAAADGISAALTAGDYLAAASTAAQNAVDALGASFTGNSSVQKTVPVGAGAAAGIGSGMAGYDFTANAKTTTDNAKTKINTAVSNNLANFKSSGAYIAAGIGKGMAGYDFSAYAKKLVQNAQNAIKNATGEGSPAKEFIPRGYWAAAGAGKGLSKYDFTSYADQSADHMSGAFEQAMGPGIPLTGVFDLAVRESKALRDFAEGLNGQMSIPMPPASREAARERVVTAKAGIDYDLLAEKLADANTRRPVAFAVGSRELAQATVNDNSRTLTENDRRVRAGYGG